MNGFRLIHLRRLFEHPGRTLLSITGIAIGAALVVAVLAVFGSLTLSVDRFVESIGGVADLEVNAVSNEGFDETLFFKVAETEGVAVAAPVIRTQVLISAEKRDARGRPVEARTIFVGLDQRSEELGSRVTQRSLLSEEDAERVRARAEGGPGVFIGAPLAAAIGAREGGELTIHSSEGPSRLQVLAVLEGEAADFNQGTFLAAALPVAQRVLGKTGRLDGVLVQVEGGRDVAAVRSALQSSAGPTVSIDLPSQRAEQAELVTRDMRNALLMGVAMALTVGAFLIFNTMNMAATERRRELATLRAIGGRRGRLLAMFLMEAATLGLIGSILGAGFGAAVGRRVVENIPPFFTEAIGVEIGFHLPPRAVPTALVVGVLASILAAALPARKAVTVPPVESMRPEGALDTSDGSDKFAPIPSILGAAMAAVGFGLAVRGPSEIGYIFLALFIGGIIVASYGMTAPLARATAAIAIRFGVSGRLAAAAAVRAPRRSWATAVAVIVAAIMVVAQGGLFDNVDRSLTGSIGSLGAIDLFISPDQEGFGMESEFPGDWGNDLSAIEGIAEVGTNSFKFVNFREQRILLQGVDGFTAHHAPALQGVTQATRLHLLEGKGVVVSDRFSELYGLGEGDPLELPTPGGIRTTRVIGTAPSLLWERGHVSLSRSMFIEWFGHVNVGSYAIALADGADEAKVTAALTEFLEERSPINYEIAPGTAVVDEALVTLDQINALFSGMTTVVVGAAALAILNALLISIVERRRELGIMRAVGSSRRQLRRMIGLEALSLGVVGAASGAFVGFFAHRAAMAPIVAQSGFPIEYRFVVQPALMAFAIGIAIAVAGSILPARRAGSINIIEAIGYE